MDGIIFQAGVKRESGDGELRGNRWIVSPFGTGERAGRRWVSVPLPKAIQAGGALTTILGRY
jgi:hypothetical protein